MRDAGTEAPHVRRCSGSVARVSKKRNIPEEKSRARFLRGARFWRCAWACVCGFRLGLGLVLGLGLSRRSSPSPSPSPSRVIVSAAWARFLRGFPSAIPAPPGALPTKQTRQNADFSFVLGFVWCASPVRKFRLYGTIAPRSAFVCRPDALHLPAGVVARSLRFRLVLGLVLVVKVARFQLTPRTFPGIFSAHSPQVSAPPAVRVLCSCAKFPAFSFGFGYYRRVSRICFPHGARVVTALPSRRSYKTNAVLCSLRILFGIHDARNASHRQCIHAVELSRESSG